MKSCENNFWSTINHFISSKFFGSKLKPAGMNRISSFILLFSKVKDKPTKERKMFSPPCFVVAFDTTKQYTLYSASYQSITTYCVPRFYLLYNKFRTFGNTKEIYFSFQKYICIIYICINLFNNNEFVQYENILYYSISFTQPQSNFCNWFFIPWNFDLMGFSTDISKEDHKEGSCFWWGLHNISNTTTVILWNLDIHIMR